MKCSELTQYNNTRNITSLVLMGRIGKSEQIATAVLYLASDDAKFTTCTSLVVDGGLLAQ